MCVYEKLCLQQTAPQVHLTQRSDALQNASLKHTDRLGNRQGAVKGVKGRRQEAGEAMKGEGNLDESGAMRGLWPVVQDGPTPHCYQALNPAITWHAPATPRFTVSLTLPNLHAPAKLLGGTGAMSAQGHSACERQKGVAVIAATGSRAVVQAFW